MQRTNPKSVSVTLQLAALSLAALLASGCSWAARHHNILGAEAFQAGQLSKALSEFQLALSKDSGSSDAYYNLGATYFTLAKQSRNPQWMNQAEQLLRQSIALNQTNVDAHRTLAVLLVETNRPQFAFDLLNTWRQRNPMSAEPLVELARLHQEFGDSNQATNHLADALRLDGNHSRALKAMGHVRERQGQWALALENYMRSYQVDQRQTDLAAKINELQTRLASLPPQSYGLPNSNVPNIRY